MKRNWRKPGPAGTEQPAKRRPSKTQTRRASEALPDGADRLVSPNTVLKWSRMLQAAFERANRNAGKKCVRGVVPEHKLLPANPWSQFTWVEGAESPIRQFDADELLGFLRYLETNWPGVPVAATATKVLLWSCCRKIEVAGLTWEAVREVDGQVPFEVVGKWGVERWIRVPPPLYREMLAHKTDDGYVFAAYVGQISRVHAGNAGCLKKIREQFDPENFGRWLYERVKDWAVTHSRGNAYLHVFRKTGLQFTHDGEEEPAGGSPPTRA